jgi:hypothetical protein
MVLQITKDYKRVQLHTNKQGNLDETKKKTLETQNLPRLNNKEI